MRTKLRALEHHAETGRAGDAGQPRAAMPAIGRVRRNRRAATVTIERRRIHDSATMAQSSLRSDSKLIRFFEAFGPILALLALGFQEMAAQEGIQAVLHVGVVLFEAHALGCDFLEDSPRNDLLHLCRVIVGMNGVETVAEN